MFLMTYLPTDPHTPHTHTLVLRPQSPPRRPIKSQHAQAVQSFVALASAGLVSFDREPTHDAHVVLSSTVPGSVNECCAYGLSKWFEAYRSGRRRSASRQGCLRRALRRKAWGTNPAPLGCLPLRAPLLSHKALRKPLHQYRSRKSAKL